MTSHSTRRRRPDPFTVVRKIGLELPGVEAVIRYDGAPALKVRGCFMAGIATHPSAERDTLVVRVALEERELLLEDAPAAYYVSDYYRKYPLVLVRLRQVDPDALRDLLATSWRLTCVRREARGDSTPASSGRSRSPKPIGNSR